MMVNLGIARRRLGNQLIAQHRFEKPVEVVQWLGAVQAQDYAAAKWALGLRLPGATENEIEQAYNDGIILRTHVMRPTWHFVTPADIRWLLMLTASRVKTAIASYDRKYGLDEALFARTNEILAKALQGGRQLTRNELVAVLREAGIVTESLGFLHIMMHAELDGVICSGARRGKQFTYALLDERAPQARQLEHDEALAEFVRRYFTSHGPATLLDFVWWSGLTGAEAKRGLELAAPQLLSETIAGQTYWFAPETTPARDSPQEAYLLSCYDEYTVGYTDRGAVFDASYTPLIGGRGDILSASIMVLDGQIIGTWRRDLKKNEVVLTSAPFLALNEAEARAFAAAADRYGTFLGLPVQESFQGEE